MNFSVKRDLLRAIGGVGKDVKDGLGKIRGFGTVCGGRGSKGMTKTATSDALPAECVDVDGDGDEGVAVVEDAEPAVSSGSSNARSSRAAGAAAKRTADAAALATASLERKHGRRDSESPSISPTAAPVEEHQPQEGLHQHQSMYLQQPQPAFQPQPQMYQQQQHSYLQPTSVDFVCLSKCLIRPNYA